MTISFRDSFYALAFTTLLVAVLIFAQDILVPLSLALLLSFILFPLHVKLIQYKFGNIGAAFTSIALFFGVLFSLIAFFSAEIISLSDQLSDFQIKLMGIFTNVLIYFNENVSFIGNLDQEELIQSGRDWLKDSGAFLIGKT